MNPNIKNTCKTCDKETILSVCISCLKKTPNEKVKKIKKTTQSNDLLVDKYAPKSLKDIVGNKQQIIKASKIGLKILNQKFKERLSITYYRYSWNRKNYISETLT